MIPTAANFRLLIKIIFCVLLSSLIIFTLIISFVYSQFDGTSLAPKIDCVVVFGAAVHKGTLSGPGIERRVRTAADLYVSNNVSRLILTGGKGSDMHDSEAEVMRRTAMRYGVAPEDIFLEENATSTWENLMFSRPIANSLACKSPIVGISDAYHLARIRFIAYLQGWGDFRTLPAGERPLWKFETWSVFREVFGIIYYFVDSFISLEGFFIK